MCTKNPTLLRIIRINNKEEYFVNKGIPKDHDPGERQTYIVTCKQLSHYQSLDYEKLISGEKRSLIDKMTEPAIVEKSNKESDTNVFVKKYMKAAYWLFKYEITHTTNFDRLLDLLCLYDKDLCHFSQTRPITATYRSKSTVTEFLEIMSNVLDRNTTNILKKSISLFHGCRQLSRSAGHSSRRIVFDQIIVRSVKVECLSLYHNIKSLI